jgi:hypothetical protein
MARSGKCEHRRKMRDSENGCQNYRTFHPAALTTVPFPTPEAAAEWIEANKFDMAYSAKLGVAPG